jgi:uncharacterized protein YabE (DUF348 family)/3D (Asp-Asp-Asp) domain-containing protein
VGRRGRAGPQRGAGGAAGGSGSFRRLALFPVPAAASPRASARRALGALAVAYARPSLAGAGRGLIPLPGGRAAAPVPLGNVPLWSLLCLFAAFSLLWSSTMAQVSAPAAPALMVVTATDRVAIAADAVRRTAAAVPRAGSVILARWQPGRADSAGGGDQPWWTLVEIDGRVLRTAANAESVEAALAAAGFRLEEGDRVLVLANAGAPLAADARGGGRVGSPGVSPGEPALQAAQLASHLPPSAAPGFLADLAAAAAPSSQAEASSEEPQAAGLARSDSDSPVLTGSRLVVQRAVPFSVVDAGVPTTVRAAASTVGEALGALGVDVHSADLVLPATEAPLVPGLKVAILRAQPVTITAPDLFLEVRSRAGTVGALLAERELPLGPLDRVEPPPDDALPASGTVRIVRVREEERSEQQALPFRTQVQSDAHLPPGRRLRVQAGLAGLLERVVKLVYEDDVEVHRAVASEVLVRPPIDEVIAVGPAAVPAVAALGADLVAPLERGLDAPPEASVRSVITMVSTAYDAGPASTGKAPGHPAYGITASGMRARYGVVAVDPQVIPFHTRLYVPGYGYAVAADTGGAIKGNRIDLFYPTYDEAIRWGRRTVPVYILH